MSRISFKHQTTVEITPVPHFIYKTGYRGDYPEYHSIFTKYLITGKASMSEDQWHGEEVCWQCETEPENDRYQVEGRTFCSRECLQKYLEAPEDKYPKLDD